MGPIRMAPEPPQLSSFDAEKNLYFELHLDDRVPYSYSPFSTRFALDLNSTTRYGLKQVGCVSIKISEEMYWVRLWTGLA